MFACDTMTHIDVPPEPLRFKFFFPELYPNLKSMKIHGDILDKIQKNSFKTVTNTLETIRIILGETDVHRCLDLAVSIFGSHTKKHLVLDTCFGGKCEIVYTQRDMAKTHTQTLEQMIKRSLNVNDNRKVQIKNNVIYII